ncbi:hypothetical protein [Streptosporangium lutulentum]|uniref:PIN domain-containing protein n=1 Tax=Streptosporangium lutulentum TaxID=1461250 RepID=A0ABT9QVL2_9ACTN|nr:hypothetical protein [Streptosporangium lutulentum]MDP9850475.1 hypothetical protein [Streptosporangium lutulentum]
MTFPSAAGGFVLDPGALVELGGGLSFYAAAFVERAAVRSLTFAVPAAALSEAWQHIRQEGPSRIDQMQQFISGPLVIVVPLDAAAAYAAGELVEQRDVGPDVTAAHVATIARERGWPIAVVNPDRVLAVDPKATVAKLPGT